MCSGGVHVCWRESVCVADRGGNSSKPVTDIQMSPLVTPYLIFEDRVSH